MPVCGASGPGLSRTDAQAMPPRGGASPEHGIRAGGGLWWPSCAGWSSLTSSWSAGSRTWYITQAQICFPMERCRGYMNRNVSSGRIEAGSLFIRSQPYRAPDVSEPQLFHWQCGARTQHTEFGGWLEVRNNCWLFLIVPWFQHRSRGGGCEGDPTIPSQWQKYPRCPEHGCLVALPYRFRSSRTISNVPSFLHEFCSVLEMLTFGHLNNESQIVPHAQHWHVTPQIWNLCLVWFTALQNVCLINFCNSLLSSRRSRLPQGLVRTRHGHGNPGVFPPPPQAHFTSSFHHPM